MVYKVRNWQIFGHWAAKREFWKNWDGLGGGLGGGPVGAWGWQAVWCAGDGAVGACEFVTGMV